MTIIDDLPARLSGHAWHLADDDHAYAVRTAEVDGEVIQQGVYYAHRDKAGELCEGWVQWIGPGRNWQLISLDPLHVEPSIACRVCGDHGFIRGGKWVPA